MVKKEPYAIAGLDAGCASLSDKAQARAKVLVAYEKHMINASHGARSKARDAFVAEHNARSDHDAVQSRKIIGKLSAQKLKRWRSAAIEKGPSGLEPNYGCRKDDGLIDRDPALRDFVIAQIAARPHISAVMVHDALRARFDDDEKQLPAMRTVERFMAKWKENNKRDLTAIADPDAWRSKYQAAGGSRSQNISRPNQLWELDSTMADLMLIDPDTGKPKRYHLISVVDVATRRVKMIVDRTSRAASIGALMRKAMLDWGVPEAVKTDNGADYTSHAIEDLISWLEIERIVCPPFTPEAKPHVERAFKTFQHQIVELLPGYVGHDVTGRKSIESRRSFANRLGEDEGAIAVSMTPDEFQETADKWADDYYGMRLHRSLGRSPFEEAAAYQGELVSITDERALDVLLLPARGDNAVRVVSKKGIHIKGGVYTDGILGAMIGDSVRVMTDPADLGHVYVFNLNGDFICEAINHLRRGVSAEEVAARMKAIQRQATNEAKGKIRQVIRAVKTDDIAREILTKAGEDAGKIVRIPNKRTSEHMPPALHQAGLAARTGDFEVRRDTPEDAEGKARTAEKLKPAQITTRQTSFERARAIERAINEQRPVSQSDRDWLERYQQSADYKSQMRLQTLKRNQGE